jgi:hypothetical protein
VRAETFTPLFFGSSVRELSYDIDLVYYGATAKPEILPSIFWIFAGHFSFE